MKSLLTRTRVAYFVHLQLSYWLIQLQTTATCNFLAVNVSNSCSRSCQV